MSLKKKAILAALAVFAILINVFLITYPKAEFENTTLSFTINGSKSAASQVFYGADSSFSAANSAIASYTTPGEDAVLSFAVPSNAKVIRIDFGSEEAEYEVSGMTYTWNKTTYNVSMLSFGGSTALRINDIGELIADDGRITLTVTGEDPYVIAESGPHGFAAEAAKHANLMGTIRNFLFAGIFDAAILVLFIFRKRFSTLPIELWQNRVLILQLAKNDFKTKYAGSVFGIIWAFIQPTVTVVVYWFVFQIGLGAGDKMSPDGVTYAFVLWLMAGLVPWFFFQDTLVGGTNALLEYTYLVKKVVFKISILPIVKEISALFVHLFFIGLMMVLYTLAGHFPSIYWLQVIYYSGCLFMYCLGVSFATCAIVVFFRDLSQIITIIIQVQVWLTPIMWDFNEMAASGRMPGWLIQIFKLNPMFYIVNGYRDSMINHVWFFERLNLTVYFWVITGIFFVVGAFVFKRLKVHFADTL